MAGVASLSNATDRPVELLSPVPPMLAGTASYLSTIVERVARVARCADLMTIGVDPGFVPEGEAIPRSLHGVPVVDHRLLAPEVPAGRVRIFFLANNDHHAYVCDHLARQTSFAYGKIIAVIHDPAAFMINRFMTGNGEYRQSVEQLQEAVAIQYGAAGSRFLKARLDGHMPEIFEFVTHCHVLALTKAHEVWVHSLFGLAKLIGETSLPAHHLPKIRVCAHPAGEGASGTAATGDETHELFRIGVFGWVTPPKRITSVIRGLALACDRLGPQSKTIELLVVGRRPADSTYDPAGEAARYDVADRVRFVDYPDAETFTRLQEGCHIIFNLRYPSCGETSGTLATAEATGAMVVTSRYQAFHETEGARSVTVLAPFEDWEIASAICSAFETKGSRVKANPPSGEALAPVEKLLLREVLSRGPTLNAAQEPYEAL